MLADLNDLQAAQDQTAAKALVSANKALDSKDQPNTQVHHQRSATEGRITSPPAVGRLTDKYGRRIFSPPLSRTNSATPSSIPGTPRGDHAADSDVDRAASLLSLYEIRAKLKEQDNSSLIKAREKINALAAKQQQQQQVTAIEQKKIARSSVINDTVNCFDLGIPQTYNSTGSTMAKNALVLLDVQTGIVDMVKEFIDPDKYVAKASLTLAAAREAGVLIVQVTTGFRPSYADASPRNQMTARVRAAGLLRDTDASVQLHPAIAESAVNDIHIKKRRVSALYGNDLDIVLRSSGIERLAIAGLATSGAVLSTVRQAFDMDYEITVLADLCADSQVDVHDTLLEKVLSKQAAVMNAEEWLALL
ncbi:hypothetical protein NUW58_g3069 [Xylaria curta]|uniref:Uncharacterized protein n=1 Tax=Xylaria curta TaxID=42375 RepID=A0ACC1PDM0_9PEZI|nr:hypothetical protein NUW58_g3069 [Xylaria curta]